MKKWLRLGVALALGPSGGWAVDWIARHPKPEAYISDFAQVVDAAGKSQIEAYAAIVDHATGARIFFVTLPSLEGEPVEDVAGTIFRGWGTGETGKESEVLLLFSIAEHRFRMEESRNLAAVLPASLSDELLRAMRPALRKDDIGDAIAAAAQTVGGAIARAKHVHLTARLPRRRNSQSISQYWDWMLIAVVAALAWLLIRRRTGRRASFGGRGSGGFGAFDSGDGFGGFGGADSGVGSISSDW